MKIRHALMLASVAALLPLSLAGTASADTGSTTYTAMLEPVPLNGQDSASGEFTLVLTGDTAKITGTVSGMAAVFMDAPFPHVQHIHGKGGAGECPVAADDANGDGVMTTADGTRAYGDIDTTLSLTGDTSPAAAVDVKVAPSGSDFTYDRTFKLSQQAIKDLKAGKGVIVVHGLDPATAPALAATMMSALVPTLPEAATAPAICGVLLAAPSGAVNAGGDPGQDPISQPLYLLGGAAIIAAGVAFGISRRNAKSAQQ